MLLHGHPHHPMLRFLWPSFGLNRGLAKCFYWLLWLAHAVIRVVKAHPPIGVTGTEVHCALEASDRIVLMAQLALTC